MTCDYKVVKEEIRLFFEGVISNRELDYIYGVIQQHCCRMSFCYTCYFIL